MQPAEEARMTTNQAGRDDAARLNEAGETSLAAGTPAVEVTHLRKSYGSVGAVDDVSFSVAEGEILGILGPAAGPRDRRRATSGERVPGQAQGGRDPRHVPPLLPKTRRRQRTRRSARA